MLQDDIKEIEKIMDKYGLERESEVVVNKIHEYTQARRSES